MTHACLHSMHLHILQLRLNVLRCAPDQRKGQHMRLGNLDIYTTRRTATCAPSDIHERSFISIQQGWTPNNWQITVGAVVRGGESNGSKQQGSSRGHSW
jgi:hypothetical protein